MSVPSVFMDALTTVSTLLDHIHAVVEVGTKWMLMDALAIKVAIEYAQDIIMYLYLCRNI